MTWALFIDTQLNRNPYTEKSETEITGTKFKLVLKGPRWDHGPLHQVWQSNSQLDKWSFSNQSKGRILHCDKAWCVTITHSACQSAEGWARASVSSHCTSGAFSQLNCSRIHPGFLLEQILRIQRHSSLGNFLQNNCFWNPDEFERIVYSQRMLYHRKKSCFKGIYYCAVWFYSAFFCSKRTCCFLAMTYPAPFLCLSNSFEWSEAGRPLNTMSWFSQVG